MMHFQLKFQEILSNFGQFWLFCATHRFLLWTRSTPRTTLKMGKSIYKKLSIFGFFMKNYTCSAMAKTFHQVLSPQKVKKHAKNDFLPLFGHTRSSLGRLQFWRGKWTPNWEITLGLESRHPDLSHKPTFASFGCLEVPQNVAQKRATRWELGRYASRKFARFSPTAQQNADLTSFDFLEWFFILLDVILWFHGTYLSLLEDSFIKSQKFNEWIGFLAYRGKWFWLPRF